MKLVNPIPFIMAFLGYVKIPVEVVQLSMAQEGYFEMILRHTTGSAINELTAKHLQGQKTITQFLRTGRRISG